MVQGSDCSVVIKTAYREMVQFGEAELSLPYSEEILREAVSLLVEEAAIEGDGCCRAVKKSGGVTGCVVTPLTIGTAPLLLYLARWWSFWAFITFGDMRTAAGETVKVFIWQEGGG